MISKEVLENLYLKEKLSCNEIKNKFGIKSKTVILRLFKKYGIKTRCPKDRPTKSGKDNKMYQGYKDLSKSYWYLVSFHAKDRKLDFSITIEYAWSIYEKQNGLCALSGVPIYFKINGNKSSQTASIDRIDSNLGYIEGNIQWVHKTINKLKMDMEDNEFINWCAKVAKFRGNL